MDTNITNTPYATQLDYLSDLQDYLGKEVGLTPWTTISQDKIDAFAKTTEDDQWIHTDVERSKVESPYGNTIAHGFLVLSMASKFTYQAFSIADVAMGVNYGLDKVRFPNATPSGAEIRGRISLLTYEEIPGGSKYKMKLVIEIKGQEKPACVAEFIGLGYVADD